MSCFRRCHVGHQVVNATLNFIKSYDANLLSFDQESVESQILACDNNERTADGVLCLDPGSLSVPLALKQFKQWLAVNHMRRLGRR